MSIYKICGVGLLSVSALLLIKNLRESYAHYLRMASSIIFFGAVFGMLSPILSLLLDLTQKSGAGEYATAVIKALGIAYLTHITASICRDCGEGGIASGIENVGRVELILLALPLFTEVIRIAEEMLSW